MLKEVVDFKFDESARKVYEFIFEGIPEKTEPRIFEISEGGYKCDAQLHIGNRYPGGRYSIFINIFKTPIDYNNDRDTDFLQGRMRVFPLSEITLEQNQSKMCIAKLYIEEDPSEWQKTRNNPWHISQHEGQQLIMVFWHELIERWDNRSELNVHFMPEKKQPEVENLYTEEEKLKMVQNVSAMQRYYQDYSPQTAIEILDNVENAYGLYCEEGGRWGPGKFRMFVGVIPTTIGRYIKAFKKAGIKSWKNIELP